MRLIIYTIILFSVFACHEEKAESQTKKKPSSQDLGQDLERNYGLDDTIKTKALENIENLEDGPVIINYSNGLIKAKGVIKDGKKNSLWESFYPDGTKHSSTYFFEGKQHGYSITYHKNGAIQYKGEYRQGKPIGHWEFFNEEGEKVKEKDFE